MGKYIIWIFFGVISPIGYGVLLGFKLLMNYIHYNIYKREINVCFIGIIMQPLHVSVPTRMFQICLNKHAFYATLLT